LNCRTRLNPIFHIFNVIDIGADQSELAPTSRRGSL
jgi:hypothetical protein